MDGPPPSSPIADGELAGLFDPLFRRADGVPRRVTLAVSGGPDSTALMLLAARWSRSVGVALDRLDVAVVDHRLRAGSAEEAAAVAATAERLGFRATILVWTDPPERWTQDAARTARYRLLVGHARAQGSEAIATGHTQDDQAETLMMRLSRGSGVNGLAAMRPSVQRDGVALLRPLLGVAKSRLVATLASAGIGFVDDPSNDRAAFERVRWRRALADMAPLGVTSDALARSARRLQRAAAALATVATDALADPGLVTIAPAGFASLDRQRFAALPEDIRVRVLLHLLRVVGGVDRVSLAGVEDLVTAFADAGFRGGTLAGCRVAVGGRRLVLTREPGRQDGHPRDLPPGATTIFDRRFAVTLPVGAPPNLAVVPAGIDGSRRARAAGLVPQGTPAAALRTMPAVVDGRDIVALPALPDPAARRLGCICTFPLGERLSDPDED